MKHLLGLAIFVGGLRVVLSATAAFGESTAHGGDNRLVDRASAWFVARPERNIVQYCLKVSDDFAVQDLARIRFGVTPNFDKLLLHNFLG